MAQNLISGLYPYWSSSPDTIERTQVYLRTEQPGPALRRMLMEGRDSLARALRAQMFDAASSVD
jgi:aminopeptidase N